MSTIDGFRSRRSLLAAAVGGAVGALTGWGRPTMTQASDGDPVLLGNTNSASSLTHVDKTTTGGTAVKVTATGIGAIAVHARSEGNAMWRDGVGALVESPLGFGVKSISGVAAAIWADTQEDWAVHARSGSTEHPAVRGWSEGGHTGVEGYSGGGSFSYDRPAKTGVFGFANQDASAVGVLGQSIQGTGVQGTTDGVGIGVMGAGVLGPGVRGTSQGTGVEGAGDLAGVSGSSTDGTGVSGVSETEWGVVGRTNSGARAGVAGLSDGGGTGVHGYSNAPHDTLAPSPPNTGVYGFAAGAAARGVAGASPAGTGVHGYAGADPAPAPSQRTGIYGRCDLAVDARGVSGYSTVGRGINGATSTGTGVYAKADQDAGVALIATGRVQFNSAGGASIPAGSRSVVVNSPVPLASSSKVLVTLLADPGSGNAVQYVKLDPPARKFTVYVLAPVPALTKFAYFVIS